MYWVGMVLQGYILRYSTVPLVLVWSGTYLPVMRFTIQEKSTFRFGTGYILSCTALIAVQLRMYPVPNQNAIFSWIVNSITGRYVPLQTRTSGTVLYLSTYPCSTVPYQLITMYAQSLYSEEDRVAGLQRHCNVEVWECLWHNPVLSTY